jgi:hypothetical protein
VTFALLVARSHNATLDWGFVPDRRTWIGVCARSVIGLGIMPGPFAIYPLGSSFDSDPSCVARRETCEETQMSADDEAFIPYLVLVRFDKDGGDLKRRLAESVPALKDALADIGKVQFVEMSYDGSMAAFLVAANPRFEDVLQVQAHLQSPRTGKSSALVVHDKVLVVTLETGTALRMERTTSWLREFGLLVE